MHELSIALNIVETAEAEAARSGGGRVVTIRLRIGPLSGVSRDALLFSYPCVCEGTALEGSQLAIEEAPGGSDLEIVALEVE